MSRKTMDIKCTYMMILSVSQQQSTLLPKPACHSLASVLMGITDTKPHTVGAYIAYPYGTMTVSLETQKRFADWLYPTNLQNLRSNSLLPVHPDTIPNPKVSAILQGVDFRFLIYGQIHIFLCTQVPFCDCPGSTDFRFLMA